MAAAAQQAQADHMPELFGCSFIHSYISMSPFAGLYLLRRTDYVIEMVFSDMPVPARFLCEKGEFTFPQFIFMTSPFQSSTEVL